MLPTTEHCLLDQHLASSTSHASLLTRMLFAWKDSKHFNTICFIIKQFPRLVLETLETRCMSPRVCGKRISGGGAVQNHFRHAPLANPYYPLSDVRGLLHLQPRLQLNMLHVLEAPIFGVSNIFYS